MTSQIPFTPLTAEALARLTPDERNTFALAAEQLAADQKPSMMTIVALVETVGRLIGEQQPEAPAVPGVTAWRHLPIREYRVLPGDEDPEVVLIGQCAETVGCLFQRTYGGENGVALGVLIDTAMEHEGVQGEQAHARIAGIAAEWDAYAEARNAEVDGEPSCAESPAPVPAEPASRGTLEAVPLAAALGRATGRLSVAEDVLAAVRQRAQDWASIAPEGPQSPVLAGAGRWILAIIGTEGASNGGLRQRPGDQQLPVPNDGPSMHDLAADDVRRRHPGGRAPEIRAIVYCKQWLEENDEEHPHAHSMRRIYRDLLTGALTARRVTDDIGTEGDGREP